MSSTTSYSPTLPGSSAAASPSGGVVISGATSGLGRALAERFVRAGWRVGAAGRDASALDSLRLAAPSDMATMQIDVCDPDAPVLLRQLADAIGGMDIYLHCPGILVDNDDLNPDIETRMAMTNSVGFARMISAAFRYFRDSGRSGRIVAITSVAGCRGLGALPAYSASKAFGQAYLEALRQRADHMRLPLKIIDIRPGWTRTPLLNQGRSYMLEMDPGYVADRIFHAALHARRSATVDWRWKILTILERLIPSPLWQRLHIPFWRDRR